MEHASLQFHLLLKVLCGVKRQVRCEVQRPNDKGADRFARNELSHISLADRLLIVGLVQVSHKLRLHRHDEQLCHVLLAALAPLLLQAPQVQGEENVQDRQLAGKIIWVLARLCTLVSPRPKNGETQVSLAQWQCLLDTQLEDLFGVLFQELGQWLVHQVFLRKHDLLVHNGFEAICIDILGLFGGDVVGGQDEPLGLCILVLNRCLTRLLHIDFGADVTGILFQLHDLALSVQPLCDRCEDPQLLSSAEVLDDFLSLVTVALLLGRRRLSLCDGAGQRFFF
mmetsp:Transcript_26506/g.46962  ORF Transcript_26506/g.46962 Transcript_26506/m.46962 type:complete len:282 (-) Transcript_26506:1086-1931(-)